MPCIITSYHPLYSTKLLKIISKKKIKKFEKKVSNDNFFMQVSQMLGIHALFVHTSRAKFRFSFYT